MSTNQIAIEILKMAVNNNNKKLILIVGQTYDRLMYLRNQLLKIFDRDNIKVHSITLYRIKINNTEILFNTLVNQKKPSGIRPDLVLHF